VVSAITSLIVFAIIPKSAQSNCRLVEDDAAAYMDVHACTLTLRRSRNALRMLNSLCVMEVGLPIVPKLMEAGLPIVPRLMQHPHTCLLFPRTSDTCLEHDSTHPHASDETIPLSRPSSITLSVSIYWFLHQDLPYRCTIKMRHLPIRCTISEVAILIR
jgi:hypothetical protein